MTSGPAPLPGAGSAGLGAVGGWKTKSQSTPPTRLPSPEGHGFQVSLWLPSLCLMR